MPYRVWAGLTVVMVGLYTLTCWALRDWGFWQPGPYLVGLTWALAWNAALYVWYWRRR
jgi:hypothetical protein